MNFPRLNTWHVIKRFLAITGMSLATVAWSQSNQIRLDSFAYKTQIDTKDGGPFFQITLPIQVYQGVQQSNLADVRVFNHKGEAVPYTWLPTPDAVVPHVLWTDPIKPQAIDGDKLDYEIAGQIPLEQLRINSDQANTLTPVLIQRYQPPTKRRARESWETLAQTTIYRLQSPHGEVVSPDLMLNSLPTNQLQLVLNGKGSNNIVPTIQIGFIPKTLVFLAQGTAPFTLAWGAKEIPDGSMSYSTLLPGYQTDKEYAISTARLHTIAPIPISTKAETIVDKTQSSSKGFLWGILAVGLLALAGMAIMLLRQIRG